MSKFQELLACPRCDAKPLVIADKIYICKSCKNNFPLIEGIPFVFPEPTFVLAQWRERLNHLCVQLESDAKTVQQRLKQKKLLPPTRQRLQHIAESYLDQAQRLSDLLSPLGIDDMQTTLETYMALQTRLPQGQGLTTYYANIHRDWCWGGEENKISAEKVLAALGDEVGGKVLVMGAGACRLAYDVHRQAQPELTVALDINPLLLIAAKRIMHGEELQLYEFPIAPKSIEEQAVLRELSAPVSMDDNFHFILADALHPPFSPASFDVVITPWLLDILPEDLRSFAPRVNRLLTQGGKWVNFGSLSFAHDNLALCYSLEEVELITAEAGFNDFCSEEGKMPYMQSPASRHGRVERVITFHARKQKKIAKPKRYHALPDWIVKGDTAVPLLSSFQMQAMATRIHAFIMALIDGKRSVKEMALVLEQQRLMPREEAEPAIRAFLTKMYEEKLRHPNF